MVGSYTTRLSQSTYQNHRGSASLVKRKFLFLNISLFLGYSGEVTIVFTVKVSFASFALSFLAQNGFKVSTENKKVKEMKENF